MPGLFTLLKSIYFQRLVLFLALGIPQVALSQIPPTAVEDEIFTFDNIPASGSLAENDLNPSGSVLTYELLGTTNFGDLVLNPNGTWTFNPYPDVAAVNQQMFYEVCDPIGQCSTGLVWLYVQFQNNAPEPEDDYLFAEMNEPRFGDVSSNDFDPDYLSDPISTINSYAVINAPDHGDIIFNIDGTFQYTPDPGFTGSDNFTYNNCDACAVCASASVFITVLPSNDEPTANNSTILELNEDGSFTGTVSSLTSDPENDQLTHSLLFQPDHGVAFMNQDGTFQYIPDEDYFGSDEFMYLVCDIVGQCAAGFVYLNVINQNDPPVTASSSFTTNEDFPSFSGNASTGDSDDTGNVTYSLLQQPTNGTATINLNGSFTYSPDPNFFGADTLRLNACDAQNACSPDFVYFTITPLNDWPIANPDDFFGFEDEILSGTLANDIDVDGDVLTYSLLSSGNGGVFQIESNGVFTFSPNANFSGFTSATYQVCDPANACSQSTLTLEIIEINDDPIINPDNFTGNEDQQVMGNVLTNDIEPDGEIIYYFTTSNPEHGTIDFNPNGNFTYTPDPDWSGTDVIQFYGCDPCAVCSQTTLTITILPVNDVPVSQLATYNLSEDNTFNGNLTVYNTDVDDIVLQYSLISNSINGSVNLNPSGTFTFTPSPNYSGSTSFTYQVCDDENGCATGTVNLNISPVNDSPVAMGGSYIADEDTELVDFIQNDSDTDGDELTFTLITAPMNGVAVISEDGQFSYSPEENYNGSDMFTYEVCDTNGACDAGVIDLTVQPLNDAPVAGNLSNVTYQNEALDGNLAIASFDPDGDDMTFTMVADALNGNFQLEPNGSYVYNPNLNFSGSDQISFEVCDAFGACNTGTLSITVFTTNTAPVSEDVSESINEDQTITDNLGNYVADAEGGVLSFNVTSQPLHGTLSLQANGNFTYVPDDNYFGNDQFSFEVCDTGNMCDNATVSINITSVNDSPVVFNENFTINEEDSISGDVSENDSDVDDIELFYIIVDGPIDGDFEFDENGTFSYTPVLNYYGEIEINYQVCDANDACSNGVLFIEVLSVNDQPNAANDEVFIDEDNNLSGALQTLINDADDAIHIFSTSSLPVHGYLTMNAEGDYTYNPDNDFFGTDSFTYRACDDDDACTEAICFIYIAPVNDAPLLSNDFRTINEDHSANGNVALNDEDADDDELTYTILTDAVHGELTFDANGNFVYTPFENEFGNEEFMIQVCDDLVCDTSYLYIEIIPENDPPVASNSSSSTPEDIALIGNLDDAVSDPDLETLSFSQISSTIMGTFDMSENGNFVYTPNENEFGTEIINFEVCDAMNMCTEAQLTITITPVNDAPVALGELIHVLEEESETNTVAGNDNDPDNDVLTYALISGPAHGDFSMQTDGTFTYTPELNYWGPDEVTYSVCDASGLCAQATLLLEVDFVNDAPIIIDETIQVIMNQSASGSVATNDIELDFEVLNYFIFDDNSNGIFTLYENGDFEYTPFPNVYGTFTLTYYACDPCAVCSEGTITLVVVPEKEANTAPQISDFSTTICHGESTSIELLTLVEDNEESATALQYNFNSPSSGVMMFDAETQVLTFQSDPLNDDPVAITYSVCDNGIVSLCDDGEIVINVAPDIVPVVTDTVITDILCFGQSNGSINISVEGTSGMQYAWSNNATAQDLNNIPAGTYAVTVTSNAECFISETFTFEVNQPESALSATINMVADINDLGSGSIGLEITGGTPPYNVTWIGPGGFVSNEEDLNDLVAAGNYAANITDASGCSATANAGITSVDDIHVSAVFISPNPCQNELNIRFEHGNTGSSEFTLHNALGQIIQRGMLNNVQHQIDMSGLAPGCYYLGITNNTMQKTWSVVKQ